MQPGALSRRAIPAVAMQYAEVAVNVPLDRTFHYVVPPVLEGRLRRGARVRVPFGKRSVVGYCVGLTDSSPVPTQRLKTVSGLLDPEPLLDEHMLALTRWIADEYLCGWGEALEAALPGGVRRGAARRTVLIVAPRGTPEDLRTHAAEVEKKAPRQAAALRALAEAEDELVLSELAQRTGADASVARALARKGWVEIRREAMATEAMAGLRAHRTEPFPPTPHQRAALETIAALLERERPGVLLLHGVTGSGKTEVYLQALRRVVDAGRQGIVLVPEISLTPQTVRRFAGRFERVALLHSRLTEAERREQWHLIRSGEAEVVIGARSAVFAPTRRLGLIVVDEEHESTFKQQSSPRYHAAAVAMRRGALEGALVVLGSATPSLESYHRARQGEYALATLPTRVADAPLPGVEVVDMRTERARTKRRTLISRRLAALADASLARGEQVIFFLNRRGFSTWIVCRRCGHVVKCPRCEVSLVYHRRAGRARCHHCGADIEPPTACPVCNSGAVSYLGAGTQRIEEVIQRRFPDHPCARMDSDTTRGRTRHRDILAAFREGKTRILLGTQMIAKGLDLPNVTVVGVIDADVSLNLPDFRASERTFQLLAQVAGRTGRGFRGGRVVIQTSSPEQACIRFALRHDYPAFARHELAHREALGYPPFGRLARLIVEGTRSPACERRCAALAERLRSAAADADVEVLGPAPAPLSRIRGRYRHHVMLKERTPGDLHRVLRACRGDLRSQGGVQVIVDVDPVSLL